MSRFPVLMYHRILSPTCPIPGGDSGEERYAVDLDEFIWQLDRIEELGLKVVSMGRAHETLDRGKPVPDNWVVMTFDDGNYSDFEHARPLLADKEFCATFFVCGARIGADGGLTPSMLQVMQQQGFEIGSHGMTHRFLNTLSDDAEWQELAESRRLLFEVLGRDVEYFSAPGGRYGRRTLRLLGELSYRAMCTSRFGYNGGDRPSVCYGRIPIVRATGREQFMHIVQEHTLRLLPLYLRSQSLQAVRTILGEAGYRRARAAATRGKG